MGDRAEVHRRFYAAPRSSASYSSTAARLACIGLIVCGIAGLKLAGSA
ncbi:Quaternary ammonium compound-resistance protein SugE [Cupriavidus necator H850]|nr:Quaternary ammonium compound-resistance protein SugE [Cupriavidus necator H850]